MQQTSSKGWSEMVCGRYSTHFSVTVPETSACSSPRSLWFGIDTTQSSRSAHIFTPSTYSCGVRRLRETIMRMWGSGIATLCSRTCSVASDVKGHAARGDSDTISCIFERNCLLLSIWCVFSWGKKTTRFHEISRDWHKKMVWWYVCISRPTPLSSRGNLCILMFR